MGPASRSRQAFRSTVHPSLVRECRTPWQPRAFLVFQTPQQYFDDDEEGGRYRLRDAWSSRTWALAAALLPSFFLLDVKMGLAFCGPHGGMVRVETVFEV